MSLSDPKIPFNKPYLTGKELHFVAEAHSNGQLAGDGEFTKLCSTWLEERIGCEKALLTHSCTAALEMAAMLSGIEPGDEVIMPSYTFVSTANAFVLRGGVPVFVDIRPDTLNIDESLIEAAISSRTRAIVPVHYAGVACDMDRICDVARQHGLLVIEDAAQAVLASYKGRALGSFGQLGCYSFHETKNIISGEGGALLVNAPELADRAEIIREKGTNRSSFFRGQVDKYTWVDVGSSYLPGEVISAFLWAQMQDARAITARRLEIWNDYHSGFASLEQMGRLRRPVIPDGCEQNAHMYYLILNGLEERSRFIEFMRQRGISCVFHYVPLHSSPFGQSRGRVSGHCLHTDDLASRLVRLPLWIGVEQVQARIIDSVTDFFMQGGA
ncbi:MAG: dTDP-4-amino-4,6-dideoxygalactose transaminase [Sedimenticola thiotaurini]|uniref:dTDP-4-amino-4,6-dideoxygalactose transaminase n=1 Tax=Sedimenticola thiotaurini TaxID=1543721 RepID=A0A558DAL9_9GAMM|nr:MAG: dTDP-4-amino-4,6-dideoxygalactose transaminase [Sedimenticola thiotaurini]